MTNLKTLKDMQVAHGIFSKYKGNMNTNFIDVHELKAEAIKWVKLSRYEQTIYYTKENKILEKGVTNAQRRFLQDWIKHFFNITEEDLK